MNKEELVSELKSTRVNIDGLFQAIAKLPKSREVALAYTSCQLSKMWLGKCLAAVGTDYPYKESKDPSTGNYIAPTADEGITWTMEGSVIEIIKIFRASIDKVIEKLKEIQSSALPAVGLDFFPAHTQAITYLTETGMWLGMELGRIRDLEDSFAAPVK